MLAFAIASPVCMFVSSRLCWNEELFLRLTKAGLASRCLTWHQHVEHGETTSIARVQHVDVVCVRCFELGLKGGIVEVVGCAVLVSSTRGCVSQVVTSEMKKDDNAEVTYSSQALSSCILPCLCRPSPGYVLFMNALKPSGNFAPTSIARAPRMMSL